MAEIRHRVGIAATPAAVFGALSTTDGISEWRVRDLDGDPSPGRTLICDILSMAIGFSPSTAIGSPHRRPSFLPTGGHEFSPRPGGMSDRRGGAEPGGRGVAAMVALSPSQARGLTPLPAVACASR